ncbi:hypothetical protein GNP66_02750 [Aliivibrio fischeri]|nr:hypothetical protein [Aliivibrio fischeri]
MSWWGLLTTNDGVFILKGEYGVKNKKWFVLDRKNDKSEPLARLIKSKKLLIKAD